MNRYYLILFCFEKLPVASLVKKLLLFCGTCRAITVFTM